jgi:preprotein translocase subunit SecD
LIAAFLTVLGYSINDTIVIFDRIRENRGKLTSLSANVINNSINQTLSRTVLTSGTTLMVVLVMYLFGGAGIHGFNYVLLAGILVGTYSSVAIAAPLLMYPHLMRIALYGIAGMLLIGLCLGIEATGLKTGLIVGIVVVAGLLMIRERLNWDRPIVTAT